jgi:hypothetical protein
MYQRSARVVFSIDFIGRLPPAGVRSSSRKISGNFLGSSFLPLRVVRAYGVRIHRAVWLTIALIYPSSTCATWERSPYIDRFPYVVAEQVYFGWISLVRSVDASLTGSVVSDKVFFSRHFDSSFETYGGIRFFLLCR